MSSASTRLPRSAGVICPAAIRCASASASADLPTPGSPRRQGLFSGGGREFQSCDPARHHGRAPGRAAPPVRGASGRGRIYRWGGLCGRQPSAAGRAAQADRKAGGIPARPAAARCPEPPATGWPCRTSPRGWRRAGVRSPPWRHWPRAPPARQTPWPCSARGQGPGCAGGADGPPRGRRYARPGRWMSPACGAENPPLSPVLSAPAPAANGRYPPGYTPAAPPAPAPCARCVPP